MTSLHLGYHASCANGYLAMGEEAKSIDADTFQFFSRNPRGSHRKVFDRADAEALKEFLQSNNFAPLLVHAPYTMNPCSADPQIRHLAKTMFREDLEQLETLPGNFYLFHPGSHVKQGVEVGIKFIVEMLDETLPFAQSTIVLLETMAGKGSEIGGKFAEIAEIRAKVKQPERLGVCLDTCHVFSGGYDIVNDLDAVLADFDREVGLKNLRAVHLNDSKTAFGLHQDRHEKIGDGQLGLAAIIRVITHPQLRELPFFLETPNDLAGYAHEIKLLRAAALNA